jgi:hypothetical protein
MPAAFGTIDGKVLRRSLAGRGPKDDRLNTKDAHAWSVIIFEIFGIFDHFWHAGRLTASG